MSRVLRARLAVGIYATAGLAVGVCWVFSLAGGGHLSIGPISARITSWKVLRWIAVVAAIGLGLDPLRRERLRAMRDAFENHHKLILALGLALAAAQFTLFKVTQLLTFETGIDLTQSQYTLHSAVHGQIRSLFGDVRSYMTFHFSPLHLLLAPAYAVFPSPFTLLSLEALAVVAASVPLYKIARTSRLSRATSTLVALAYLNNPLLWRAFFFDFHIEPFAPLLIFSTVLAVLRKKWRWFYVLFLLTLGIKEEMPLVLLGVAAFVLWFDRSAWRHAAAAGVLALAWGLLAFKVVMPLSDPENITRADLMGRWSHLGESHAGILLALARDPAFVVRLLISKPVRVALASLGGLPLLEPVLLLGAAPSLVFHLSSNYEVQSSLGVYYAVPAMSLLFVATPRALGTVARRIGPRAAFVIALSLVLVYPGSKWSKRVSERDRMERRLLAQVPADARISAQAKLIPHLSISPTVTLFPERAQAEWVLLDVRRTPWPLAPDAYRDEVRSMLEREDFGVVEEHDGIVFLRRTADRDRNAGVLARLDSLSTAPPLVR